MELIDKKFEKAFDEIEELEKEFDFDRLLEFMNTQFLAIGIYVIIVFKGQKWNIGQIG